MNDEESYQIMPYKEVIALRKDIDSLKSKNNDSSFQALLNSMSTLTKSMNSMLELFRTAAEEMKLEEKSETNVAKEIGPLSEKVDTLVDQNKTIAEGLVAISDMVKELKSPQLGPAPVFRLEPRRSSIPPMRPESPFEEAPPFNPERFQPKLENPGPMPPPEASQFPPPGPNAPPFPPGPMPPRGPNFAPFPGPMPPRGPNFAPFPGPMPPGPNAPLFPPGPMPPPGLTPPGPPGDEFSPLEMPSVPEPPQKKGKFLGFLKK